MAVSATEVVTQDVPPMDGEGNRTVIIAIVANIGVGIAKIVAGVMTGSSAMLAEAFHSIADTGNEALLLVAQWRGRVPPDEEHPLGHGREAYFWALLASLGVFLTGAGLSFRQGINELRNPTEADHFGIAYVVLVISFFLEGFSLLRAYRQIKQEAGILKREFFEQFALSSDPVSRAVFAEDAVAVIGNVIALVGIALHQATGSPVPDAVAAILIGAMLAFVAFDLARRNRGFIIGQQASPTIRQSIRDSICSQPGIISAPELIVTFLGPRRVWVVGRVNIEDGMTGAQVKELLHNAEAELRRQSPYIARVDLTPSSADATNFSGDRDANAPAIA